MILSSIFYYEILEHGWHIETRAESE